MIELAQLLAQPEAGGQGGFHIEAVGLAGIKHQLEAQLDHQERMLEQKGAQVRRVAQAFLNADEKGFEIGAQGMTVRASKGGALGVPALHDRPLQLGKERTIVSDEWIDLQ